MGRRVGDPMGANDGEVVGTGGKDGCADDVG